MKQTAVEWLIQEWPILEAQLPQWLIEQAKEMEKEQMLRFYHEGSFAQMRYFDGKEYIKAEQYYNETFKSE